MNRLSAWRAPATLLAGLILAGCGIAPTRAAAPPAVASPAPEARDVAAEQALKKGDCRTAAEDYAGAAAHGSVKLARRATEVALSCENLPAAWSSAQRWHALAPADREASIFYSTVALKLYHIPEARGALAPLLRPSDEKADRELAGLLELLSEQSDANATFAAVDPSLDTHSASALELSAFGRLALEAYDFGRAEQRTREALERDAKSAIAMGVLARVRVLRGDAEGAIAAAREVMRLDPRAGAFELADILSALDRTEEARQELERLRTANVPAAEIDRRLALLAYQSGDMQEAKRRFMDLVHRGEANEAVVFYLAQIAERSGDAETALTEYRQLSETSMALAASVRAAGILLAGGKRSEALELLDGYESEHPESDYDLTLARAHLLGDHHDADGGVEVLTTALQRYPQHPTLEYERAVMLERAGHDHQAVQALEELLRVRPDDPNLLNALGYTLADHGQTLPRAEALIRRALKAMPDNPAVLDSLAWVHVRRGDPAAATPTLERAYTISRDPEIAAHYGEALWLSGNHTRARAIWADALARNPDSEELKATLHRLLPPGHP